MSSRVRSVCSLAGKRLEGGIGRPTMRTSAEVAQVMQSSASTIDKPTVVSAIQMVLDPKLSATEAVKEVACRLQVYGQSLPGTPVHMKLCRRQAIAIVNSGVLEHPYKYFLTYGSMDRYWPEIQCMVSKLRERQSKAMAAAAAGSVTVTVGAVATPVVSPPVPQPPPVSDSPATDPRLLALDPRTASASPGTLGGALLKRPRKKSSLFTSAVRAMFAGMRGEANQDLLDRPVVSKDLDSLFGVSTNRQPSSTVPAATSPVDPLEPPRVDNVDPSQGRNVKPRKGTVGSLKSKAPAIALRMPGGVGVDLNRSGKEDADARSHPPARRLLNPSDAVRLTATQLDAELVARACADPGGSTTAKYLRLCALCEFPITAITLAMSVADLRQGIKEHNSQHCDTLRLTGTKADLQRRLTLALRPPLPALLPQVQRDCMVAENPLHALVHYYDREKALWEHVINGKLKPLGGTESLLLRHDTYQRASLHSHCMVGGKPRRNEVPAGIATTDDICDDYASVATSLHGDRVLGYDEFGNALDQEQESYLEAIEQGASALPAVPAKGVPNVLKYDAQRRPRVPYALHPGHRRPPLNKRSHPAYKARARANRNAYQFHKCNVLTFMRLLFFHA